MKRLILVSSLVAGACSSGPLTPTITSTFTHVPQVIPAPESSRWPVQHPDGQFGHEDPSYPPAKASCPPGWVNSYNGWNFVCADPGSLDRQLPVKLPKV